MGRGWEGRASWSTGGAELKVPRCFPIDYIPLGLAALRRVCPEVAELPDLLLAPRPFWCDSGEGESK